MLVLLNCVHFELFWVKGAGVSNLECIGNKFEIFLGG